MFLVVISSVKSYAVFYAFRISMTFIEKLGVSFVYLRLRHLVWDIQWNHMTINPQGNRSCLLKTTKNLPAARERKLNLTEEKTCPLLVTVQYIVLQQFIGCFSINLEQIFRTEVIGLKFAISTFLPDALRLQNILTIISILGKISLVRLTLVQCGHVAYLWAVVQCRARLITKGLRQRGAEQG